MERAKSASNSDGTPAVQQQQKVSSMRQSDTLQNCDSNRNVEVDYKQLEFLFQLERRKVDKLQRVNAKLEQENMGLRERNVKLMSGEDEERIQLLVADRTRRKLVQLRAITARTIKSLESGLHEFHAFVGDIDEAVEEQDQHGALEPIKAYEVNELEDSRGRILRQFQPTLRRIPESPMIIASSSRLSEGSGSKKIYKNRSIITIKNEHKEEEEFSLEGEEIVDETLLSFTAGIEEHDNPRMRTNDISAAVDDNDEVEKNEEDTGRDDLGQRKRRESSAEDVIVSGEEMTTAVESFSSSPSPPKRQRTSSGNKTNGQIGQRKQSILQHQPMFSEVEVKMEEETFHSAISSTPQLTTPQSNASGRARRAAATKVQSYKLPSLNVKMRRDF